MSQTPPNRDGVVLLPHGSSILTYPRPSADRKLVLSGLSKIWASEQLPNDWTTITPCQPVSLSAVSWEDATKVQVLKLCLGASFPARQHNCVLPTLTEAARSTCSVNWSVKPPRQILNKKKNTPTSPSQLTGGGLGNKLPSPPPPP